MNFRNPNLRWIRAVMLVVTALIAGMVIAACGSSTSTTSTSTSTTASASASGTTSRTALKKCLEQHGVTLPSHPTGSGTSTTQTGTKPPAGGGGAPNPTLQAAFKACGATGQHTKSG